METMGPDHDRPADPMVGLAARRERIWGVVGGAIGAGLRHRLGADRSVCRGGLPIFLA
jgi:hypothetical protein